MRFRFWKTPLPERTGDGIDRRSDDDRLLDWLRELPEGEARAIRCDAGWTQREVAEACGVGSSSLVGKWERGGGWSRHSGLRYARLLRDLSAEVVHERTRV
jgi:DNA-binding transcriptional regulator YiaG